MASPSLNKHILDLHDAAGTVQMKSYQRWALQLMQQEIRFNCAYWGTGAGEGAVVHSLLVYPEAVAKDASCADAGAALFGEVASPRLIRLTEIEQLSGLRSVVVLRRDAAKPAFSVEDRSAAEVLVPHLLAAWRRCQQLSLYARCIAEDGRVGALVDHLGFLHAADGRFFGLLRRNWEHWGGTRLPDALATLLTKGGAQVIENVRWSVDRLGELYYLSGQPIGVAALLTLRERSVAAAILAGNSYDESASSLGISVNTLRNALVRIYRKLGVSGKVELAQRLQLSFLTEA